MATTVDERGARSAEENRKKAGRSRGASALGLGNEARMNRPGELDGNWAWRLESGQLTEAHARRLRAAAEASGRT